MPKGEAPPCLMEGVKSKNHGSCHGLSKTVWDCQKDCQKKGNSKCIEFTFADEGGGITTCCRIEVKEPLIKQIGTTYGPKFCPGEYSV